VDMSLLSSTCETRNPKKRQREGDRRRSREWHHFRYGVDTALDNVSPPQLKGPCGYVVDTRERA